MPSLTFTTLLALVASITARPLDSQIRQAPAEVPNLVQPDSWNNTYRVGSDNPSIPALPSGLSLPPLPQLSGSQYTTIIVYVPYQATPTANSIIASQTPAAAAPPIAAPAKPEPAKTPESNTAAEKPWDSWLLPASWSASSTSTPGSEAKGQAPAAATVKDDLAGPKALAAGAIGATMAAAQVLEGTADVVGAATSFWNPWTWFRPFRPFGFWRPFPFFWWW